MDTCKHSWVVIEEDNMPYGLAISMLSLFVGGDRTKLTLQCTECGDVKTKIV